MANQDVWRKLRQKLIEQGLDLKLSKSGHYKVYQGKQLISSLAGSSGGGRGLRNAKAQLRRQGVEI